MLAESVPGMLCTLSHSIYVAGIAVPILNKRKTLSLTFPNGEFGKAKAIIVKTPNMMINPPHMERIMIERFLFSLNVLTNR